MSTLERSTYPWLTVMPPAVLSVWFGSCLREKAVSHFPQRFAVGKIDQPKLSHRCVIHLNGAVLLDIDPLSFYRDFPAFTENGMTFCRHEPAILIECKEPLRV
jgi:hypothetical protein